MVSDYLPQLYTDQDLVRARRRGKVVGWLQGGAAVLAFGVVYSVLGWIPTIIVLRLVGFAIYKLVARTKSGES